MNSSIPAVPEGVPTIATIVKYYSYRQLPSTRLGVPIFRCEYVQGDDFYKLEEALAAVMGTIWDNHHAWEILDSEGRTLFFSFSDWYFVVYPQMTASQLLSMRQG